MISSKHYYLWMYFRPVFMVVNVPLLCFVPPLAFVGAPTCKRTDLWTRLQLLHFLTVNCVAAKWCLFASAFFFPFCRHRSVYLVRSWLIAMEPGGRLVHTQPPTFALSATPLAHHPECEVPAPHRSGPGDGAHFQHMAPKQKLLLKNCSQINTFLWASEHHCIQKWHMNKRLFFICHCRMINICQFEV